MNKGKLNCLSLMSLPMGNGKSSSGLFFAYSSLILSLPFYYVIFIREAGFQWDSLLTFGLISLIAAGGLFLAINNLAMTTLQQMYASHASKLKGANSGRKGKEEEELRHRLERNILAASQYYSLFMNSLLYLVMFVLLAAGLFSGLSTFINYILSSSIPAIALAYLTSPRS